MQAIILAAGTGSRLGKYTKDNTKCMLKIHGVPLISKSIEKIKNVGIKKLILVVGYQKENLIDYLDKYVEGIEIEIIDNPVYATTNNIYSLYLAKERLLDDDTILLESDLIYDEELIRGMIDDERPNLAAVDKFKSWMDGTVVTLDSQDNILNFIPKSSFDFKDTESYFKTVNIYKFSREFSQKVYVPFLVAYSSALGHNEYYEQVLRVISLLQNKGLKGYRLSGEKWYEIDDIQDKDNAEVIFSTTAKEKLELIQKRFGGYWRYPELIDFCYLVNPYFPPQKMKDEMKAFFATLLSEYPSGLSVENLLAGKMFGVEGENIVVGNGAAELIKTLPGVLEGKFGVVFPTFNEYPEIFGENRTVSLLADVDNFTYSISDLEKLSLVVDNLLLINPDNPSGHYINKQDILSLMGKMKETGKVLILDESFVDFSEEGEKSTLIKQDILDKYPNLVVIKSISKSYGVPGIRLGVLATTNEKVISRVRDNVSIWNVNSFGEYFLQIIGKYKPDYVIGCEKIKAERKRFHEKLTKINWLHVFDSQANYFLCRLENNMTSTDLTERLISKNIFIKDLSDKIGFENGSYVRIAVRDTSDNDYLLNELWKIDA